MKSDCSFGFGKVPDATAFRFRLQCQYAELIDGIAAEEVIYPEMNTNDSEEVKRAAGWTRLFI